MSKALRRLAADHGALHSQELPPYFLFPIDGNHTDDLAQLDILLAGPPATPFAAGVWKLHLAFPPNYPQQPPTANFRTPIFHPNVDPNTGGVCVETLKRDWDSKLTLRDILVTISCLLVYPNPDSALNADAGALIQQDFDTFARRAELMTSLHAVVHPSLAAAVHEAQNRGQEQQAEEDDNQEPPMRRRRTIAKVRGMRRADSSPGDRRCRSPGRTTPPPPSLPSVSQAGNDDVFMESLPTQRISPEMGAREEREAMEDSEMLDPNQENDASRSPRKPTVSPTDVRTPRRPHATPVPLGELILPERDEWDTSIENMDTEMEPEYPPSPRKSPSKSPQKQRQRIQRAESSRDAALLLPQITPPNATDTPLAEDSPFGLRSVSPRKPPRIGRGLFEAAAKKHRPETLEPDSSLLENSFFRPTTTPPGIEANDVMSKVKTRSSSERTREHEKSDARLWALCGHDITRWNRGDFDGEVIERKAARW